jgi:hypothetical protein
VHRIAAVLVGVVLLVGNLALPLLHVHLYGDHDHAEHHHGPALHGHEHATQSHPVRRGEPAGPLMGPCEPDAHVLALTATLAPSPDQVFVPAIAPATTVVANPAPPRPFVTRLEVRAHSPPGLTDSPLRAPPHALPA